MSDMITVRNLTKKYGDFTAVDTIDLTVREGDLFAFLGPNGAGKSTTINILCTLLPLNEGQVMVNGYRLGKEDQGVRDSIGVLFQENVLDDLLTVKENLYSRGALYGRSKQELTARLQTVSEVMGIDDIIDRRFGKLSGGQKRRAEIARALMSNPKVLFLDEPTTGLDPQTRIHVWDTIAYLQKDLKMTVFLTTHYMEEAANADMVAVIDRGKIVAQGTPNELKAAYSSDMLKLAPIDITEVSSTFLDKGYQVQRIADMLHIPVKDSMEAFALLKELEGKFHAFEVLRGNMDNVFVNITGHEISEGK